MEKSVNELMDGAVAQVKAEMGLRCSGMNKAQLRYVASNVPKSFYNKSTAKLNREKLVKLIKNYSAHSFVQKYDGMTRDEIIESFKKDGINE